MLVFVTIFAIGCAITFAVVYRPYVVAFEPILTVGDVFARFFCLAVVLSFVGLCLSKTLVAIPAVLFVTSMVCSLRGLSRKVGSLVVAAASLSVVLCFVGWRANLQAQVNQRMEQVSLTSLANRLDYERDFQSPIAFQRMQSIARDHYNNDTQTDFERLFHDENVRTNRDFQLRSFDSLLSAHRGIETQFQLATGFGLIRTRAIPYKHWKIDVPVRSKLSFPKSCDSYASDSPTESTLGVDYTPWHRQNLLNFVDPTTLGFVDWDWNAQRPDLTRVVGFRPHAFGSLPELPRSSGDASNQWQIVSLSLMSLLKHRPAAIYVSENLPNMNELTGVPTRPLDQFEADALDTLKEGEELVVKGSSEHLRMLGSIRAAVQCQECHQVERGTLLGAFSYRLKKQISADVDAIEK